MDNTTSITQMLQEDNRRMREAGMNLAEAAIRVCRDYDGTHRLMIAVSQWCDAVADEGLRNKIYKK